MPDKRKQYSENFWAQAMRPRRGRWYCTARAKSDVYDCLVVSCGDLMAGEILKVELAAPKQDVYHCRW